MIERNNSVRVLPVSTPELAVYRCPQCQRVWIMPPWTRHAMGGSAAVLRGVPRRQGRTGASV